LCIELGYDDAQIRKMVSSNAARMIGLELEARPAARPAA
jgi:hypothetical protein